MASAETRPWTRIQDWVSLLAGAFLALSPIWLEVTTTVMWGMVILGAAVAVMALIALAMPGAYIDEWMMALVGAAAFVAPWVLSYTDVQAATWSSWAVGVVVVVASLAAVPSSMAVWRHQHHAA
jgi:uncharacterized membrane protein HdeD (DUF308 family)